MIRNARFLATCLLLAVANCAAAEAKPAPNRPVIAIGRSTPPHGQAGKASYSVNGRPIGGTSRGELIRHLAAAISVAATPGSNGPADGLSIVIHPDLTYADLRTALTAVTRRGAVKLTLTASRKAGNRNPATAKAEPAAFRLWTPPKSTSAGMARPAKIGQVSIKVAPAPSGGAPTATYAIPGLLKNSASKIELWQGLRALKACLPEGTGLMVLPNDSVPCGAVVAAVTKAIDAGFDKIGFLAIWEPDDEAAAAPTTAPADADAGRQAVPKPGPATSQPTSAPAPATTRPARTPMPANPLADANTVIFIMDHSGSVAPAFQEQVCHLLSLIDQLKPTQKFHVICFSENRILQGPRLYPLPADDETKAAARKFLRNVTASGATNVLPALIRTETILRHAKTPKGNKTIVLISDGDFAGISGGGRYRTSDGSVFDGNQAVVEWLRDHNKDALFSLHTVCVNPDGDGTKILKAIAAKNGGKYWDVPRRK